MSNLEPVISPFLDYEATQLAAIFDDTSDQLAILSKIGPFTNIHANDAIQRIDDAVTAQKQMAGGDKTGNIMKTARANQNPLTADNISKLHKDLVFLKKVMDELRVEVRDEQNFMSLANANMMENQRRTELLAIIRDEERLRKHIKELQRAVEDTKKEKETEVQKRVEMIAHLKDQLQEMKAKAAMESKYWRKLTDVAVSQTQKKCQLSIEELEKEIEKFNTKIMQEDNCHSEIVNFLVNHEKELETKVGYWRTKYNTEIENMQIKLDHLKGDKARDLDKLEKMTRTYDDYEKVVEEDRLLKEEARKKAERDAAELRATMKIQSWWRSVMARKGVGLYGKKKKGKKGKKGKKK